MIAETKLLTRAQKHLVFCLCVCQSSVVMSTLFSYFKKVKSTPGDVKVNNGDEVGQKLSRFQFIKCSFFLGK